MDESRRATADNTVHNVSHTGDDHFKDDSEGAVKTDIRNQSGWLKAIKMAIAYSKQQTEVTATDLLQFRCWHDLAQRKRNP